MVVCGSVMNHDPSAKAMRRAWMRAWRYLAGVSLVAVVLTLWVQAYSAELWSASPKARIRPAFSNSASKPSAI